MDILTEALVKYRKLYDAVGRFLDSPIGTFLETAEVITAYDALKDAGVPSVRQVGENLFATDVELRETTGLEDAPDEAVLRTSPDEEAAAAAGYDPVTDGFAYPLTPGADGDNE